MKKEFTITAVLKCIVGNVITTKLRAFVFFGKEENEVINLWNNLYSSKHKIVHKLSDIPHVSELMFLKISEGDVQNWRNKEDVEKYCNETKI